MAYTHRPEHDIFGKWLKKWKSEDKLDKIKQFRSELEREKSKISPEEYQEAKDYLDKKENELKENRIYNKNTMKEDKLKSILHKLVKEELALFEKKKKKDESDKLDIDLDTPQGDESLDIDTPVDIPADTTPVDAEPNMDMSGGNDTEKSIGKGLQMALDAAKQLPDSETKDKLIRQIGNTALFFLKTQIPTGGQA